MWVTRIVSSKYRLDNIINIVQYRYVRQNTKNFYRRAAGREKHVQKPRVYWISPVYNNGNSSATHPPRNPLAGVVSRLYFSVRPGGETCRRLPATECRHTPTTNKTLRTPGLSGHVPGRVPRRSVSAVFRKTSAVLLYGTVCAVVSGIFFCHPEKANRKIRITGVLLRTPSGARWETQTCSLPPTPCQRGFARFSPRHRQTRLYRQTKHFPL